MCHIYLPNIQAGMEFKYEELVETELIIGRLLAQGLSIAAISEETEMSRRIVSAHIRNMKVKLHTKELSSLRKLLQDCLPGK
jgi:DNA-binding NarL/FixJ family response regulator